MSEEHPKPEVHAKGRHADSKPSERRATNPRPEIDELTRAVSRLVHAGIVTSTDLVSGLVQIHGNILSEAASAVAKPLQSALEKKRRGDDAPINVERAPDGFIDLTESVDRSIKDVADLLDRSVQRFSDEYSKR